MTKDGLRKIIKEKEKSLSFSYKKEASEAITKHILTNSDFINAKSVFIYMSLPGEPSTDKLIEASFRMNKAVYVPYCIKKGQMKAVRIYPDSVLYDGYMGIKEPEITNSECADDFDIAIIPCVSASDDGRRLGHGGGFYDIFLKGKKAKTYCLCFKKLMNNEIPTEEHDVCVFSVVTEKT
ncbi:MAG: 5-formyltetrahydrofolate cyclo-ligase [Clostridia bacterium]|nr:5-formyltetrahydrofolate cyclo-ligase [Clostridia bacterium]